MSFSVRNLSALTHANGFTLWHYKSKEPIKSLNTKGYFNGASTIISDGDMMIVSAADEGRLVSTSIKAGDLRLNPVH